MPMTPARLQECLLALDWTQRGIARKLGRPESTIRQWTSGTTPIPKDVETWLEKLVRFHARTPAPGRKA